MTRAPIGWGKGIGDAVLTTEGNINRIMSLHQSVNVCNHRRNNTAGSGALRIEEHVWACNYDLHGFHSAHYDIIDIILIMVTFACPLRCDIILRFVFMVERTSLWFTQRRPIFVAKVEGSSAQIRRVQGRHKMGRASSCSLRCSCSILHVLLRFEVLTITACWLER